MKSVKYYITITLLILIIDFSHGQSSVKIMFFNKTGYDLSDLSFANRNIGKLISNDSTAYLAFDSLQFSGVFPSSEPLANIENIKLNNKRMGFCGTGRKFLKSGLFKFDIILLDEKDLFSPQKENYKVLKLSKHL